MCNDCVSVRVLIEDALDTLCYQTTPLNRDTLVDALEHTTCYQTDSVVDIPMNRIHGYICQYREGTTKKAIESRLNRCKRDFINSLTTGDKWKVFGIDKQGELYNMTEHEFIMYVSAYVVKHW